MKKILLVLLLLPFMGFAQVIPAGTYKIGSGEPAPYTTLVNAIARVNASGISGPVIFLLKSNETLLSTLIINSTTITSANTLTIKPDTGENVAISGNLGNSNITSAIIKIEGSDYVTIDGSNNNTDSRNLTLTNISTSNYNNLNVSSAILWIANKTNSDGATNNTIKNVNFIGSNVSYNTSTSVGIVMSGVNNMEIAEDISNSNTKISNNSFTKMKFGIWTLGGSYLNQSLIIENNTFGSSTDSNNVIVYSAIKLSNIENIIVKNNSIIGVNLPSNSFSVYGIYLYNKNLNSSISSNKISNITNTEKGIARGIEVDIENTIDSNLLIYNNMINNVTTTNPGQIWESGNAGHGISIKKGKMINIYYNTVVVDKDQEVSAAALFVGSGSSFLNVRNNIFANTQSKGRRFAVYSMVDKSAYSDINYNDYYIKNTSDGNGFIGHLGNDITTLANWIAATTKDGNSINVNPTFVSATDLHLQDIATNSVLKVGTSISGITTDIDGETRDISPNKPYIGADEICTLPTAAGTITGTASVCAGTNVGYTVPVITNATSYLWSYSGTGVIFTNGTTNNPTIAFAANATSGNLTVKGVNSCGNGTVSANYTVTVNVASVGGTASSSPSVCEGSAITNITHTTTGATGISAATGLPTGVSASWASNTITISGTPTASGTFNYSIPLTGGCSSVNATGTITVNSLPTAPTVGTTQPTCVTPTGSVVLSGLPSSGTLYQKQGTVITSSAITGTTMTISGLGAGSYTFYVSNGTCTSPETASVVINAIETKTWNGSAWTGPYTGSTAPTLDQNIEFSADYSSGGDVEGCSCQVNSGVNVDIDSGHTLTLTNGLDVLGTIFFKDTSSLVQINNNAINKGSINYKRYTTKVKRYDFTYWSSPVEGQTLKALSPNTLGDKYYSYNPNTGWVISYNGAATMVAGNGYLIRAPQTFSITVAAIDDSPVFIGKPNNGEVSFSLAGNKVHLLGNPYPSAMDANTFLDANSAVLEGTLYFWTHNSPPSNAVVGDAVYNYTSNDYATYNRTGGVGTAAPAIEDSDINDPNNNNNLSIPTGKIASGQGFFAPATTAGGKVLFNNSMRVGVEGITGSNSQVFKVTNSKGKLANAFEKNRIWVSLRNNEGAFKQTLIGYVTGATNEYESSFDGESFDGNQFVDFYSVNGDKNLVIQGRALPFDEKDEVAIGYKTNIDGDFTINIDQVDGSLTNQNIFIEDKLTNTTFDLKSGNYTFTTVSGTFNDRFVLRYTNKTLGTNDFSATENKVLVSCKNKEIKVNSFAETIDKVIIYDLLGRQIYQKDKVNSNEVSISNLNLSHQTLVVKTTLQNGITLTDKIIY